ncbi:hypothetical protein FRB96_002694 [Tulasnella sp. 330]|nr:hypothetical protein FRB96_002694 [Tulasnella sp. 330]
MFDYHYRLWLVKALVEIFAPPVGATYFGLRALSSTCGFYLDTVALSITYAASIPAFWAIHSRITEWLSERKARRMGVPLLPLITGKRFMNLDLIMEISKGMTYDYPGEFVDRILDRGGVDTARIKIPTEVILTRDPEVVKYVTTTGFSEFHRGEIFVRLSRSFFGQGILTADGSHAKWLRANARPFFARERINDYEIYQRNSDKLVTIFKEQAAENKPSDLQDLFSRFTMDTADEFLFGATDLNTLDAPTRQPFTDSQRVEVPASSHHSAFASAYHKAQLIMADRSGLPPVVWSMRDFFWDPQTGPMAAISEYQEPLVRKALEKKEERSKDETSNGSAQGVSYLDHLVQSTSDARLIRDQLNNMMIAARDSTTMLMSAACYLLAKHPDAMTRLRDEISSHLGPNEMPRHQDIKNMKYLRAVINEALRLFPPISMNVRAVKSASFLSTSVGRFYIPKPETQVIWPIISMQKRRDLWGDDAHEFDPTRWLDEERIKCATGDACLFTPFHAGPRFTVAQSEAVPKECLPPPEWKARSGRMAVEDFWPVQGVTLSAKPYSPASNDILEETLSKIKCHVGSSAPSQKAPALLLRALEAAMTEQSTAPTPVAYFASLITTLDQALKRASQSGDISNLDEGAILPATLYLLGAVLPTVPSMIIRTNLPTLLPMITQLFPTLTQHPSPLCSQIVIFGALLRSLEAPQFSTPQLRQSYASMLELTMDPRQKVRSQAQYAIKEVLRLPPSPMVMHPYLEQTADYVMGILKVVSGKNARKQSDVGAEVGVWCCGFIRSLSEVWPESHLPSLIQSLLCLGKYGSPDLTALVFEVLVALLNAPRYTPSATHVSIILQTILASPPSSVFIALSQAWLELVENTMVSYGRADPMRCSEQLLHVWRETWSWLKSESVSIRISAEKALGAMLRYCLTHADINEAVEASQSEEEGEETLNATTLGAILKLFEESTSSISFIEAQPHVLYILSCLISRLRIRTSIPSTSDTRPPTAAEVLLPDFIAYVAQLRTAEDFEYRERADDVLGMAVEVMGPEAVLSILPLNLLPSDVQDSGDEGRGYLLPLLSAHIFNAPLKHFVRYFVPLSEKLFDLQTKAEQTNKMTEVKIWEACVEQIWACFKGYCDVCPDLSEAFDGDFAQLLTGLLYTQLNLRPAILRGLTTLFQTTKALASSSTPSEQMVLTFGVDRGRAQKNLAMTKSMAGDLLSVLFNVFSGMQSDSRAMVSEPIAACLAVADPSDVLVTYEKVTALLNDNLKRPPTPHALTSVHTMLDLLLILIPFLDGLTAQKSLDAGLDLLEHTDPATQKRTYRNLASLAETGRAIPTGKVDFLLQKLEGCTERIAPGSKPDRMRLFAELLPHLPPAHFGHIAVLLPEIVLGIKEANERTVTASFDCLVAMGKLVRNEGGSDDQSTETGAMEGTAQTKASLEGLITMLGTALAGSSPHMASAAIMGLARILFEFKGEIPEAMQSELVETVIVFLSSPHREIVKASLGYIKVAVAACATNVVLLHLDKLVPALLKWTHTGKGNKLRNPTRHTLGAMIKRYGFKKLDHYDEEGNGKVLASIHREIESGKKKKATAKLTKDRKDADEVNDLIAPKTSTGNAFDDVLYGSDSDMDDGEAEADRLRQEETNDKNRNEGRKLRLRIDDDDPMDLLAGTAGNIKSVGILKRRQPGQDAAHFKLDEGTGRLMVEAEDRPGVRRKQGGVAFVEPTIDDVAGRAYMDQLVSVDGFARTAAGVVKFHKDTKKRRAVELEESGVDVDMEDGGAAAPTTTPKRSKRPQMVRLGREYKAKKAAGDVKRAGEQDPHAYLTLREMAGKKKGHKTKYSITGRR